MSNKLRKRSLRKFSSAIICLAAVLLSSWISFRPAAGLMSQKESTVKLTKFTVKGNCQSRFRKAMSDFVFSSLKVEGNIMTEAYFESSDTTALWIIERWDSQESLNSNLQTRQAKELAVMANEILLTPPTIIYANDLEPLPKNAYLRKPKVTDNPFTAMLFVDTKQGMQEEFKKLYHQAMPGFRGEQGVITYQLSQVTGDETKFITYEKFRNEAAFQYHLNFPPIEPLIRFLRTSIKQPPFEKGLHNLIEFAPLYRE